jgi:ribose 5-phosphate isomerase A
VAQAVNDPRAAAKRDAAVRAVDAVRPGMVVGLGTGSTAAFAIEEIGRRLTAGMLRDIVGIPTSNASHRLALECAVPLGTLEQYPRVDVTIDGADEIDPVGRVLKGGGGALLREKIVISAARRFVVVAETPKKVDRLGEHARLPVEVVRFAWADTRRRLAGLLPASELRQREDGEPYLTDEGHFILDCAVPPDADVDALDGAVKQVPGVVEHGLFIGMVERALLGRPDGGVEVVEHATSGGPPAV